jgi:predicted nuclease with TOPRIM domain
MATTIETDLKEVLGEIKSQLNEIQRDVNTLTVDMTTVKADLSTVKEDIKELKGSQRSRHWFSLIEGRKSYWAKVREIKKPI